MQQRIGLYSGTFDPVHQGHLAFAQATLQACNLDAVIFLPERQPRDKQGVTDMVHRVALLKRVVAEIPQLQVAELDSDRFTVKNTLPELRSLYPDAAFTLLVGSDLVHTFSYRWEGLDILLKEVGLAIGMRAGDDPSEVTSVIQSLEDTYAISVKHTYIRTPEAAITSSQIRKGLRDAAHLHPSTLSYLQQHSLYAQKLPR